MTALLRGTAAAVTVALACAVTLTSCSGSPASEINYAVDGTLTTYNTNTVAGAASGGPQAFARVLTGFDYHGPDGQIVGDHDFGTISVVGRAPLVLDYVINDKAVYSDGKPVTCDDLVLAWASQSGRFPASTPRTRPATATSPPSTARRDRSERGCPSRPTAGSSISDSCSRPRR